MGMNIREVRPASGGPEDRFTVTLIGDALDGTFKVTFGPDIRSEPPGFVSNGEVRVRIHISPNATPGARDVTARNATGSFTLAAGFTVL